MGMAAEGVADVGEFLGEGEAEPTMEEAVAKMSKRKMRQMMKGMHRGKIQMRVDGSLDPFPTTMGRASGASAWAWRPCASIKAGSAKIHSRRSSPRDPKRNLSRLPYFFVGYSDNELLAVLQFSPSSISQREKRQKATSRSRAGFCAL